MAGATMKTGAPAARHPLRASARELAELLGGTVRRGEEVAALPPECEPRLALDSRRVAPQELFVALRGPRYDAHDFVQEAIARGARGVLVEREIACEIPRGVFVVEVEDTRAALVQLAKLRRAQIAIPVLAITGTCGKTTTKEMLHHLLAANVRVHASPRSFNNDVGLPWALLHAPEDAEALILEVGTNGPGEIAALAEIARPTHACLTMAGRGHLERLGSVDGVAREKSALLRALAPNGVAVLNADDARLHVFEEAAVGRRILRFGIGAAADVRAVDLRLSDEGVSFELIVPGTAGARVVELPLLGMPALRNFLAAFTLARSSGLVASDLALLARAESLPTVARRLERKPGPKGSTLLDDSYNANPESLLAAAGVVDRWPGVRRRILVLGEMLELGTGAAEMHRELGAAMAGRFDVLLAIGEGAGPAAEGFARASQGVLSLGPDGEPGISLGARSHSFESLVLPGLDDAQRWLLGHLGSGDLVLLKGSRLAAIDQLVDRLVQDAEQPSSSASGPRPAPQEQHGRR